MRFLSLFFFGLFFSMCVYADDFTMTTVSFPDKGALPVLYTCDGKDISPQLAWANAPATTQSLTLILSDPDAPGGTWYHWVVYNMPKSISELPEGTTNLPAGVMAGKNSWNRLNYNGPCPPKGSVHHYIFTLYALDTQLKLPAGANSKAVMDAMKGHILKQTTLTAVYSR